MANFTMLRTIFSVLIDAMILYRLLQEAIEENRKKKEASNPELQTQ